MTTSRVKRYRVSVVTAAKTYANDALSDTKAAAAAIQALYLAAIADDTMKLKIEIEEVVDAG